MRQLSNSGVKAGAWGLAAGVVGSLCCIGPSAAILLGLGASSALLGFTPDRVLTLAGGIALLAVGVALAWRRARTCDLRPAARWRSPVLMFASFALVYGLLGWLAPALAARQEEAAANLAAVAAPSQALSAPPGQAAAPRRLMLSVEKMDCPPCAAKIRTALKRQPTVLAFAAEEGNEQVTIDYDSSRISAKKLSALIPAHYGVKLLSDQVMP